MIRFLEGHVKVVSDNEFINEFKRRENAHFWKTIDCIHTTVKSKIGIGHPFIFKFYAPIDTKYPNEEIHYNFKKFEHDEYLKLNDGLKYCLK